MLEQGPRLSTHDCLEQLAFFGIDLLRSEQRERAAWRGVEYQYLPKQTEHPDQGDRIVSRSPRNPRDQLGANIVQRLP